MGVLNLGIGLRGFPNKIENVVCPGFIHELVCG
jgi:hypothetical protein